MLDLDPSSWLNVRNPADLHEDTVEHDRFDEMDFEEVSEAMGTLHRSRERLEEVSPAGEALLKDLFYSLDRPRPKLRDAAEVRPRNLPNRSIMAEAMDLPDWRRLHAETKSDPWFAGMAATAMAPRLVEIVNRLGDQQEKADQLDKTSDELADAQAEAQRIEQMLDDLAPDDDPGDLQQQLDDVQAQADALAQQAADQAAQLDQSMAMAGLDVRAAMQEAVGAAADKVDGEKQACSLWSVDPGELQRMSADEHLELARKLDSTRLRELARLYGAMKYDVQGARSNKSRYTRDEVYSIEQGNDLSRILPSELVNLKHPVRKYAFYRDFVEGRLLQWELRGEEPQAQGGIFCLIDTSISMEGQRELFAKAGSMHLWDIARSEDRPFVGIVFSGPGKFVTHRFDTAADYTTDRMIAWAEATIKGGTCFETPLNEAMRILAEEYEETGAVSGSIVMITDGECSVRPEWFEHFESERKRMEFDVHALLVGGGRCYGDYGLEALTEGKVTSIRDVFTAKDARPMFAAL